MDLMGEMAYKSIIKKVNKYLSKREYKNAVDVLLSQKNKCQNNFNWHLIMGTALAFMGKEYLDQADNEFDKAIELANKMGNGSELIVETIQKNKKDIRSKEFEINWI